MDKQSTTKLLFRNDIPFFQKQEDSGKYISFKPNIWLVVLTTICWLLYDCYVTADNSELATTVIATLLTLSLGVIYIYLVIWTCTFIINLTITLYYICKQWLLLTFNKE